MKTITRFLLVTFFLAPLVVVAQVGIGTVDPDPSALLELFSKSKGLLVPRMTTQERDAISSPANGLLIYNITTSDLNYFDLDWKGYPHSANNYDLNVIGDITTTTTASNEIVTGMAISPPSSGKYKVTFNSYYHNALIIRGPFTSVDLVTDLNTVYNNLNSLTATVTNHPAVIGNGEVLMPGVYTIAGATSTAGTINFDGGGDPNALFVIRIGAAFSTGASTKMVLLNGAKASNIFWVVEGASSMAASTIFKGTVITNGGAIAMAAGGDLEGRLFAIAGAVSFSTGKAIVPSGNSVIDLGMLSTFVFFSGDGAISNAGTSVIKGDAGTNLGAISGFDAPTIFKGSFLNAGGTLATSIPNTTNALGTFGIYQNGVLISGSNKELTSNGHSANLSLHAIATILPNQTVDVRWSTNSEKIVMGNRSLTLIKLQ